MLPEKHKIAIIRSNPIMSDPRVIKIAHSLGKKYTVLILGWDRECMYKPVETISKSIKIKRFRLKAPYGSMSLVPLLPIYQVWVLLNLLIHKPDVVHACDLDGAMPSYILKLILRRKMVFDVFDRYGWWSTLYLKIKKIYPLVKLFEETVARNSDWLITVSRGELETFRLLPKCWAVVPNYPMNFKITKNECSSKLNDHFKVVFAGSISPNYGLLDLCEVVKDLEHVRLILSGRMLSQELLQRVLLLPNVEYIGLLPHKEALELQAAADVIPVLIDPALPKFHTVNPNKLFEAMMLGIPVITNVLTDEVTDIGCGIVVHYGCVNEIREAILYLKNNPKIRMEMGSKGRVAFEHKYNWTWNEKKLFRIYNELLKNGC